MLLERKGKKEEKGEKRKVKKKTISTTRENFLVLIIRLFCFYLINSLYEKEDETKGN